MDLKQAQMTFRQSCPIAKSSIGQHFRHSMDHIQRVVRTALDLEQRIIHCVVRERGGAEEQDMDLVKEGIERILKTLEKLFTTIDYLCNSVEKAV